MAYPYPWEREDRYSYSSYIPQSIPPEVWRVLNRPVSYYANKPIERRREEEEEESWLSKATGAVGEVGSGVLNAFGTVVGAPKHAFDWAGREVAKEIGLTPPPGQTLGQMARQAILPADPAEGGFADDARGIIDYGNRAMFGSKLGGYVTSAILDKGPLRSVAGKVGEFATDLGTDPLTYLMGGLNKLRVDKIQDAAQAARIAAKYVEPGIAEFAPKVAGWADEAAAGLQRALSPTPVRNFAEKALHRGFQAQMGMGALHGGMEASRAAGEGDWNRAIEAGTEAALSGLMVALPPALAHRRRMAEAKAYRQGIQARQSTSFAEGAPTPTDSIPLDFRSRAKEASKLIGKEWNRVGEGFDPRSATSVLHPDLQPFAEPILAEAQLNKAAIGQGTTFLERIRRVYGDRGPIGIKVEGRNPRQPDNFFLVQRAVERDGKIKVVGAAQVDGRALTFLAGGKAMDSPTSVSPLYEVIDANGIARGEYLSPYGRGARERWAEKQRGMEGEQGRVEESVPTPLPGPVPSPEDLPTDLPPDVIPAFAQVRPGAKEIGDTGLYSQLRFVVDDPKTQGIQTGEQWMRFLSDPKRGVKKAEMEDTGLGGWLRERSGARVKREEVQGYLEENATKVGEVVRSNTPVATVKPLDESALGREIYLVKPDGTVNFNSSTYNTLDSLSYLRSAGFIGYVEKGSRPLSPRYDRPSYNLPGGTNYTERLLVTPKVEPPEVVRVRQEAEAAIQKVREKYQPLIQEEQKKLAYDYPVPPELEEALRDAKNEYHQYHRSRAEGQLVVGRADALWDKVQAANEAVAEYQRETRGAAHERISEIKGEWDRELSQLPEPTPAPEPYTSPHWKEPNVNVHARTKDDFRTLPDGPSVLYPDGKVEKYTGQEIPNGTRGEKVFRIEEEQADRYNRMLELRGKIKEARERNNATDYLEKEYALLEASMPLPGEHAELISKRLIKLAADQGYDRIAWTTGDQQLQRWRGVASMVDEVLADRLPSGQIKLRGMKGGRKVVEVNVPDKELHLQIGETAAADIRQQLLEREKGPVEKPVRAPRAPKLKPIGKVQVNWMDRMVPVDAFDAEIPGLAITRLLKGGEFGDPVPTKSKYTITHTDSGLAISSNISSSTARATLARIRTELPDVNWNLPKDALLESMGREGRSLMRRITNEEIAEQLAKPTRKTPSSMARISGQDLAVGGEGKRLFYDQQLPSTIKKLTGKFGVPGVIEEVRTDSGVTVPSIRLPEPARTQISEQGFPLYQVKEGATPLTETKAGVNAPGLPTATTPETVASTRALLVRLYPDNSYIKQNQDGSFVIDLPETPSSPSRTVLFRPEVDRISISVSDVQRAHGEKAGPAVGVTFSLPHSAIVHILKGTPEQTRIAAHEHWHVLRHLGNLSPEQLASLEKAYPSVKGGKLSEELQADAFASWLETQRPTSTSSFFSKILDGVRSIGRFITGEPYRSPEQLEAEKIFAESLESGLTPERPSTTPTQLGGHADVRAMAATRPVLPVPTRLPTDFIEPNKQRINLNWHLAASDQGKKRAGANYASQSAPSPSNSLNLTSDGKPFFIGPITEAQWLEKAKAWVGEPGTPEWVAARNWYRDLLKEFNKEFGVAEGEKMLVLWGLTQQRASPSMGLSNLLRAEDVVRGFRSTHAKKAGLAHDRLITALKGETPSLAQKLSDFADAILGRVTRQWVGHDPRGGGPSPIDVHAARDVGYVDGVVINRVAKLFGKDTASRLQQDLAAAPNDGQYFTGHDFYNRLTRYLNEKGVDGGNWTPAEVQAVGWVAQQKMLGAKPEHVGDIFTPSKSFIAVEAAPGEGSPRNQVWETIPEPLRARVAYEHIHDISEEAARLTGVRLLSTQDTTGVWQQYSNPNVVFEALNPAGAFRFARVMARALHQTEVWAQRVSPKSRATHLGVDLKSPSGYDFGKRADVLRFWNEALAGEKGLGASVVRHDDGTPLLRVAVKNRAEAQKVVEALGRWQGGTVELDIRPVEILKTKNDWRKNGEGGSHTSGLRGVEASALDAFLGRAEESFRRRADAARTEGGGGADVGARVPGARGVEPAPAPVAMAATGPIPGGQGQPAPTPTPVSPGPPPSPPPLSTGRATGNPPRVETRVFDLEKAIDQQRSLGVPATSLILDHDTRQTWKSLDPEIRKHIQEWNDDYYLDIIQNKKRNLTASEVQAMDAVTRGHKEAKDLALMEYNSLRGTPDEPAAFATYSKALAKFIVLDRANVNDGTGLARALQARARIMAAASTPDRAFLRQVLREIDGISDADAQKLVQLWETGDPRISDAIRAHMAGRAKKFWILYRANLLSIPSEFANILGNTITQSVELGDRGIAAGVDWMLSKIHRTGKRERYLGEVSAEAGAMRRALPSALAKYAEERLFNVYKRAWTGEGKPIVPGTPIEHQVSPFKSKAARLLATPLDNLGIADDAFQAITRDAGILASRSYRLAVQHTGETKGPRVNAEAQRLMADILEYPDKYPEIVNSIRSEAERRVFRETPWKLVTDLQQIVNRNPWMTAVLPFIKTPANITRYALKHSPLGLIDGEINRAYKDYKAGKISQGDLADTIAPRITGVMLTLGISGIVQAGLVTGAGPSNPNERKAKLATGWQPYSMVFTDKDGKKVYIPYSRFDPVAQIVGSIADIHELQGEKTTEDALTRAYGSILSNLTNRTFLRGLMDFGNTLSDPKRYLGNWASNFSQSLTPGTMDKLAQAIDPVYRDVRPDDRGIGGLPKRIGNTLISQTPFLSRTLPARTGPTGEEAVRPGGATFAGGVARFLLPSIPSAEREGTELQAEMARIGYAPGEPNPFFTFDGVQVMLRRDEKEMLRRADEKASNELRRLMSSSRWADLPDTIDEGGSRSKQAIIKNTYAKYRSEVRQRLLRSRSFRSYVREETTRSRQEASS